MAHHSAPGRLAYLQQMLLGFQDWELEMDVIIDTDEVGLPHDINAEIVHHLSLEHPFFLTWCHRRHMKDRLEDYKWMLYLEDDLLLPFENFCNYQRNFELLWPLGFVPAFVRIEEFERQRYVLDITEKQKRKEIATPAWEAKFFLDKRFCTLSQPYHACWAMPATALRETMPGDFVRLSDSREVAASYPMDDLGKTPLVQLENDQISPLCYAWHLPNNYVREPSSPHSKIRVEDVFA